VDNARAALRVAEEKGSLAAHFWELAGGRPRQSSWRALAELPAETEASRAMSRDLVARGFRFVGPTICYAFMQAAGMVNDHLVTCPRHAAVGRLAGHARHPRPSGHP